MKGKLNLDKSNLEQANSIIINKSTFNLNNNHKILLMIGLNFASTPRSNNNLNDNECLRYLRHIRFVVWQNVLNKENPENDINYKTYLPEKLKYKNIIDQ